MIFKCPNCNGALEYSPGEEQGFCPYCGEFYPIEAMRAEGNVLAEESNHNYDSVQTYDREQMIDYSSDELDFMDCNIYTCTSCGGELSVNGVEASTFCPYCGQPTIVFSRVSQRMEPKYKIYSSF